MRELVAACAAGSHYIYLAPTGERLTSKGEAMATSSESRLSSQSRKRCSRGGSRSEAAEAGRVASLMSHIKGGGFGLVDAANDSVRIVSHRSPPEPARGHCQLSRDPSR